MSFQGDEFLVAGHERAIEFAMAVCKKFILTNNTISQEILQDAHQMFMTAKQVNESNIFFTAAKGNQTSEAEQDSKNTQAPTRKPVAVPSISLLMPLDIELDFKSPSGKFKPKEPTSNEISSLLLEYESARNKILEIEKNFFHRFAESISQSVQVDSKKQDRIRNLIVQHTDIIPKYKETSGEKKCYTLILPIHTGFTSNDESAASTQYSLMRLEKAFKKAVDKVLNSIDDKKLKMKLLAHYSSAATIKVLTSPNGFAFLHFALPTETKSETFIEELIKEIPEIKHYINLANLMGYQAVTEQTGEFIKTIPLNCFTIDQNAGLKLNTDELSRHRVWQISQPITNKGEDNETHQFVSPGAESARAAKEASRFIREENFDKVKTLLNEKIKNQVAEICEAFFSEVNQDVIPYYSYFGTKLEDWYCMIIDHINQLQSTLQYALGAKEGSSFQELTQQIPSMLKQALREFIIQTQYQLTNDHEMALNDWTKMLCETVYLQVIPKIQIKGFYTSLEENTGVQSSLLYTDLCNQNQGTYMGLVAPSYL